MSLSTFSSRIFRNAAVLAVLVIACLEAGAWLFLSFEKNRYREGGDLILLSDELLKRASAVSSEDMPTDRRYIIKGYTSLPEMAKNAPYDVIVAGSSMAEMGWVTMLRADYGIKSATSLLDGVEDGLFGKMVPVIENYTRINGKHRAVLLFCDLTERDNRSYSNLGGGSPFTEYRRRTLDLRKYFDTPVNRLIYYLGRRAENAMLPLARKIVCGDSEEWFYLPDLRGLEQSRPFSEKERARLIAAVRAYRDEARKKGCELAVVAFPTKPQQYEWLINSWLGACRVSPRHNLRELERACRENGVPFLDLEARLDPIARRLYATSGKLLWDKTWTHMNGLANRYTAKIIRDFLAGFSGDIPGEPPHAYPAR